MIAVAFLYETRDAQAFESAYGSDGEWAQFFSGAHGYIVTECLRDLEQPGRYLVVDRWETAEAYNAFIAANRDEYMRRSDEMAALYVQELRLGSFSSD